MGRLHINGTVHSGVMFVRGTLFDRFFLLFFTLFYFFLCGLLVLDGDGVAKHPTGSELTTRHSPLVLCNTNFEEVEQERTACAHQRRPSPELSHTLAQGGKRVFCPSCGLQVENCCIRSLLGDSVE